MISLVYIFIVAFSVYGPLDLIGAYTKADAFSEHFSEGASVTATGNIVRKEIKKDSTIYYVNDATVNCENGTLTNTSFIFKLDSDKIPNKSKLNIEGNISLFKRATNEGGFDERDYYNSLGYYFRLDNVAVKAVDTGVITGFDILYRLSKNIQGVYNQCLSGEEAGFLGSVCIGNKSELDIQLRELFQMVGIAHILAVSGLHVSVVCMALYRFVRNRGVGFLGSGCLAGMIAILYGMLTGGSISSVRAIGMFLIYILADILGEAYDSRTALAVMADLLLFENPLYIKNTSFIFSFGAIIGILFIAMPISENYKNICKWKQRLRISDNGFNYDEKPPIFDRVREWIASSIIFSFGITVAMLPIVTYFYYETPLYSVVLNGLVLPLMPFLLAFGLFGGFAGLISIEAAQIILYLPHYIIYLYEVIAAHTLDLPFSKVIIGRHGLLQIVVYYLVLLVVVNFSKVVKFVKYTLLGKKPQVNPREILKGYKAMLVKTIVLSLLCVVVWLIPEKQGFEVDIIDVGQGDGIYISSGDGARFFIDGGSTSSDAVGKYTLLPFLKYKGAGNIDYWFLSHMDLDHVSGVLELLSTGYRIDNIVLSSEIPSGDTLNQLIALTQANGTNIIYMSQGDICGTKHLSFKCVYPFDGITSDDINALSLSLLMEYDKDCDGECDYSGFFGGDIGAEQEQTIVASGQVGHVDLLKVSHHGSKYSSDPEFLSVLSPDVAVISCAKKNRYGHPSAEAIERLSSAADIVYYTMNSGRVRVKVGKVDGYIEAE